MRCLLTTGMALTLAGCGGGAVTNNSAAPKATPTPTHGPMLSGVDLNKPIRAAGTGWSIRIAPGSIAYAATAGAAPVDFYPVSPRLGDGTAVFETHTPDARPVTITLTGTACTAGRENSPLTVAARIGARTLLGCAGPVPR